MNDTYRVEEIDGQMFLYRGAQLREELGPMSRSEIADMLDELNGGGLCAS